MMSKKRNRSVRTLPVHDLFAQFPLPASQLNFNYAEQKHKALHSFGEPVLKTPSANKGYETFHNVINNDHTITLGIKSLSCKSSSSSVSWSDEVESESSKKVQEELQLIDRILFGIEDITPQYDEDELKEWMELFPKLRIFGKPITQSDGQHSDNYSTFEETSCHSNFNQDLTEPPEDESIFESENYMKCSGLKTILVNELYRNIANKLIGRTSEEKLKQTSSRLPKKIPLKNELNFQNTIDVENYLKVSPILQRSELKKDTIPIELERLSRSLVKSHISSAKWLKPVSPEFNSLPFMTDNLIVRDNYARRSGGDKTKRTSAIPRRRQRNQLVLPPIDSTKIINNHYRSISAMPREQKKCLSPFSGRGNQEVNKSPGYLVNSTNINVNTSRIPRVYKRWDSIGR